MSGSGWYTVSLLLSHLQVSEALPVFLGDKDIPQTRFHLLHSAARRQGFSALHGGHEMPQHTLWASDGDRDNG